MTWLHKRRRAPPRRQRRWLCRAGMGRAVARPMHRRHRCHIATRQFFLGEMIMVEPGSPLLAFSDHAAELVERVASSIVAVDGGGRWPSSGIHWRSGVIITAEEVLERDENIKLTLPGGRVANASLAGRDPTTDVAVLRFQPDGLPVATTAEAPLRAGQVVVAVGNHEGAPLAAVGIVALAGGGWDRLPGGTIDKRIC